MNSSGYLPAYTLVEVTLALLIGALVTATGFMGLRIAGKQLQQYRTHRELHLDATAFEANLLREVSEAQTITAREGGFALTWASKKSVIYEVQFEQLIRITANSESAFAYPVSEVTLGMLGIPTEQVGGLVDHIQLSCWVQNEPVQVSVHKNYAADQLLKLATDVD